MSSSHFKYVLIGGGAAASAAAAAIRQYDAVGSVLLTGQEHSRPYLRPALSKQYLLRQQTRIQIVTHPVGWYAQNNVELRTGRRVAHVDAGRRAVTFDDGDEIAFDKLLIATGASPRPLPLPGADLPNVFYLRTIDDCDRLHHAMDKARWEGRVQPPHPSRPANARGRTVVLGNGLLAVEVACALHQYGLHVDLLAGNTHPWSKYAGEPTGGWLTRYLQNHGIAVHTGPIPQRVEGDGRVQRVALSDGTSIDCDFIVAAVGAISNRDLVRNTSIAAEKAILVDDQCRTSVEGIFAAGDCAAVFDPLFGKHRVLEHWCSAGITGMIAGANMAGGEARYDQVNCFTSKVFDLTVTVWGERRFVHHRLVRGLPNAESPDFAEIGVAVDGRVAQVLAIGRNVEHDSFKELVQRRFAVDGFEEGMKDPTRDISELLKPGAG